MNRRTTVVLVLMGFYAALYFGWPRSHDPAIPTPTVPTPLQAKLEEMKEKPPVPYSKASPVVELRELSSGASELSAVREWRQMANGLRLEPPRGLTIRYDRAGRETGRESDLGSFDLPPLSTVRWLGEARFSAAERVYFQSSPQVKPRPAFEVPEGEWVSWFDGETGDLLGKRRRAIVD